jgi:hypothetical protein
VTRTTRITAAAAIGLAPSFFFWAHNALTTDGGNKLEGLIAVLAIFGTPLAIASALVVERSASAGRGRDRPERLLGLATAGLRGSRREWGAAMRAELASIDAPRERRRFARGCAVAAIRAGTGWRPWLIAIGVGVAFAVGTYAASRASLAGGRSGIMGYTLLPPVAALFSLAFATALVTRSFRSGLVTAVLALVAGLVGMLAVAMVEAAHWYDVAGVYLMDGDAPKEGGLDRVGAVLDPVAPTFVVFHLLIWAPWTVLGAAAGSWLRRHVDGQAASAASLTA